MMPFSHFRIAALCGISAFAPLSTSALVLSHDVREEPGAQPTRLLQYQDADARLVQVAGEWDRWGKPKTLASRGDLWEIDLASQKFPKGRYEFKFIINEEYESGANRFLHINEEGLIAHRDDFIRQALIEGPREVVLYFKHPLPAGKSIRPAFEPHLKIRHLEQLRHNPRRFEEGYVVSGDAVTFLFSEDVYNQSLNHDESVHIAGNFNGWTPGLPEFRCVDPDGDGVWEVTVSRDRLMGAAVGQGLILFKFVVRGDQWLEPPAGAGNATPVGGEGATNLRLDLDASPGAGIRILTDEDIPLSQPVHVSLLGLDDDHETALTPGRVLDAFHSDKPLGVQLDAGRNTTTYRLFSPRAHSVHLALYDSETHSLHGKPVAPAERYRMRRDPDGVWEITLAGQDLGKHYGFFIDGPAGDAEGFFGEAYVGDPYALAAPHAENANLILHPEAENPWFDGWTDSDWKAPPRQDAVIYETHVRHFTWHPSSGVPDSLRGTYEGMLSTRGKGTGLDHLKDLGVNYIQLMPVAEFGNGVTNRHDWGYATSFYFAPESSYATEPLKGSQVYEFKRLVNELHREGFGVILDVVYNHVGNPNVFHYIDKKYYFRMNPDFTLCNFSGCGNDLRTEAPMMRRLIVENVLFWMREYHVDGFRFDLAELIDMATLREIEEKARALNPDVLLISEPWSFRGNHKKALQGTGWAAWNDDFRERVKKFAERKEGRDSLVDVITGSSRLWTSGPMQSVNYLESHDDHALVDELSFREDKNGEPPTPMAARANRLAATVLLTSLGIPMITEGQAYLRSKRGVHNTYNRGDEYNALRWSEQEDPLRKDTLDYYRSLLAMRASPQGASFRIAEDPGPGYYQWILPEDADHALGYIVNARGERPGSPWVVLVNASDQPVSFEVDFPAGRWVRAGDGERLSMRGLTPPIDGGNRLRISVPAQGSHMYLGAR